MLYLLWGIRKMLGLPWRILHGLSAGSMILHLALSRKWHIFWTFSNSLANPERRRARPLCYRICPIAHLVWCSERNHVTDRKIPRLVLFPVYFGPRQKPLSDILELPVFQFSGEELSTVPAFHHLLYVC
jgi:hypothetical protein